MILDAGTLDDDPGIRLSANIFVASRAPWHEITDSAPCFDAYPPGMPNPVIEPEELPPASPGVVRGSCLCGGVRFEIDKAVGPTELCHCNRCRKVSGSAALLMIGVNAEDYRFLAGSEFVKTYAAPILYTPPAYHSTFCSECGSPVPPPTPDGLNDVDMNAENVILGNFLARQ